MDETSSQKDIQVQDEPASRRLLANWRSCLLLSAMLLGLLATPLAVIYRWSVDGSGNELTTLLGQGTTVNRIAYITPEGQLAVMDPHGTGMTLLTDAEHVFEFPAWSPDGSRIAVTGGGRLLLVDPESGLDSAIESQELYLNLAEPAFYLYWSPNSESISFLASQTEELALHLAEVGVNDATSEAIATGLPLYWDWAPSADGLFIHSGGSGTDSRLQMIDLNGDSTGAGYGAAGVFQAPGIARSGRFRAYAVLDEDERSRLVIQDINGQEQEYEAITGQLALAWSPTSDVLAYRSPRLNARLGGGPLRTLDPVTGDNVLLTNQNVLAFFWSPDGQTIAFFSPSQNDDGNIQVAAATGKKPVRSKTERQQVQPRLDLWVVNVASGHQRRLAQFTPTSLFLRQFLPIFDQYALSHRIWSPNSDALVIPVFEDHRSQIAVVPVTRGPVQLVADGQIAFWSHQ